MEGGYEEGLASLLHLLGSPGCWTVPGCWIHSPGSQDPQKASTMCWAHSLHLEFSAQEEDHLGRHPVDRCVLGSQALMAAGLGLIQRSEELPGEVLMSLRPWDGRLFSGGPAHLVSWKGWSRRGHTALCWKGGLPTISCLLSSEQLVGGAARLWGISEG
jgi:hypothetical protein